MKVKLTPLNILSSFCLVMAGLLFFSKKPVEAWGRRDISFTLLMLSLLGALVFFVSDQAFRRLVPSLSRIWVLQGLLIIFILILIFIIKANIQQ